MFLTGCVADEQVTDLGTDGFVVKEVFAGLDGPSHFSLLDDGRVLVSQLNGGENESSGQVLVVDIESGTKQVLYSDLDKPTGVVAIDDEVFIMERRKLSKGNLSGGELQIIQDDLPFNGRSQGTLTVTPNNTVLYNTSGLIKDGEVVEGSGTLWEFDPVQRESSKIATGFKHAYAHVFVDDELWVTEIGDGTFDGEVPQEKILKVSKGSDAGWPKCIDDQKPVLEFEGTKQYCESTIEPLALFEPRSTPTSVVASPWNSDELIVALWNDSKVVVVNTKTRKVEILVENLENPQSLLVKGNMVMLLEFKTGRILSIQG